MLIHLLVDSFGMSWSVLEITVACRDICLLSNVTGLDCSSLFVLKVPKMHMHQQSVHGWEDEQAHFIAQLRNVQCLQQVSHS